MITSVRSSLLRFFLPRVSFLGGCSTTASLGESIPFIQYLDDTRPKTRKRRKKWADLCEVISKEGTIEELFDLGFTATVKPRDFHDLYILFWLLVESSTLSRQLRHEFGISQLPSN